MKYPEGTYRLVARRYKDAAVPVVGFMVPFTGEGAPAKPGDCIEVVLGPAGTAQWRVVQEDALSEARDARRWDDLFLMGYVGDACFPELVEARLQKAAWERFREKNLELCEAAGVLTLDDALESDYVVASDDAGDILFKDHVLHTLTVEVM